MNAPAVVRSLVSGDERFAVTGASGWLGRTSLELLAAALGPERFGDQVTGFASTAKTVRLRDGTAVPVLALAQLSQLAPAPTHLLHFAYLTRDRVAVLGVPAYVHANVAITATVVDAISRFRPQGVFATSSGAVYDDVGGLAADVDSNPYGTLKHLEELAIRRAAVDAGGRSVVSRVFSLAGPYMTKPQLYALGDFILQALAGGPISVRARGRVERSYCAAADLVAVALACLLRGADDDLVFDSGGDVVEMGDLAGHVREAVGRREIRIERSWDRESPVHRYVGDGAQMSALGARHGLTMQSLEDQVGDTCSYLTDIQASRTSKRRDRRC